MDESEIKFLEFAGAQAVGDSVEMTLLTDRSLHCLARRLDARPTVNARGQAGPGVYPHPRAEECDD
jgi:hypothetical protein